MMNYAVSDTCKQQRWIITVASLYLYLKFSQISSHGIDCVINPRYVYKAGTDGYSISTLMMKAK